MVGYPQKHLHMTPRRILGMHCLADSSLNHLYSFAAQTAAYFKSMSLTHFVIQPDLR